MNNKQKNILFLLHLPPPVHGSSMVGKAVKDSELINQAFHCRYINLLMSRSVSETGKSSLSKILRFVFVWFELLSKLIQKRPDICYYALTTTGSAFRKDCMLIALLKIFRVKIFYHLHNKGIKQNENKRTSNLLYHFVFKNAYVILLSEHLYFDIEKYVSPWKVFYCPNGIKDVKQNDISAPFSKNGEPFKILFLSNLIKSKGVYDLVDACSILKDQGCVFTCDFIGGEGDVDSEQFNDYVKEKGLTENVAYLGKRYGEEKDNAYKQAGVFVLPTYYSNECFPLVILEAMQQSLPVISTFEGGIPDMIEDEVTGFLVPQRNVKMMAEKLKVLLLNQELGGKMGARGRVKYENNFTLTIFEQKLLSILNESIK